MSSQHRNSKINKALIPELQPSFWTRDRRKPIGSGSMVCVCMCGRREQRPAGRGKLRKARMKLSNMVLEGGGREQRLTPLETVHSDRLFACSFLFSKGRMHDLKEKWRTNIHSSTLLLCLILWQRFIHPTTLEEGAARKVLVGPSYETEELRIQVIWWTTMPGEQFIKQDGLWNALPSHHVFLPLDSTGDMMATTLWAFITGRQNKCWSL